MEKKRLKTHWLEVALLALPFAAVAVLWPRLPERIPIHWGWHGQVDGWSSRGFGSLFLPVVNLAMYLLMTYLPVIDPRMKKGEATAGNRAALAVVRMALTAFFTFLFAVQMAAALNPHVDSGWLVINGFLVAFLVMGNFFGNLKPNRFVGIRTPWTLRNDETWRATHRLGGRLMVFGSLALLLGQFFVTNIAPVALGALLAFAGWTLVYSWWHARGHSPVR